MMIRVAGAQIPVRNDIAENTARICEVIRWAADEEADILLTPEGSLSGYTHDFGAPQLHDALRTVTSCAREGGVGLALGTCNVEDDGCCYNQIRFYQPDGEFLGFHSKTLRCGTLESPPQGEINHYSVTPLQVFTWNSRTPIGGLICNDLWANPACTPMPDPHLSQQLAGMGARIIFHAVNGGRDGSDWSDLAWCFHESNLRMRARAGRVWVVTVDNCLPMEIPCSAPSGVIAPDGSWVIRTKRQGEDRFAYTIRLDDDRE